MAAMIASPWSPDLARAALLRAGFTFIPSLDKWVRGRFEVSATFIDFNPDEAGEMALDVLRKGKVA